MKSIIKVKFIFIVLLLLSSSLAKEHEPRFLQLPLDEGVSLNLTYDMIQDSKGFMWFGTMYGLVKYDGENYTTYKYDPNNKNSISFDDIVSIYEDSKENIWIGTWGGGLNMFHPKNKIFKRYLHNPSDGNTIADNIIWSICEDKDGIIWIGTGSGGLQILDPFSGEFKDIELKLIDSLSVKPIVKDLYADDDFVWIGHSKGISNFNLRTGKIHNFQLTESKNNSSVRLQVNAIFEDSKRKLWIGTSYGLMHYDQIERKFVQFEKELTLSITSITEDNSGNLWIGSNNGLIKINKENSEIKIFYSNSENSIAGNFVQEVLADKSGIIWVASYNAGITRTILTPLKFNLFKAEKDNANSLSNNHIRAIAEDDNGNIYIGSYGSRINVFNPDNEKFSFINLPGQKFTVVHSLAVNQDNLWIGTSNSLLKYDVSRRRFRKIPLTKEQEYEIEGKSITALSIDPFENLWVGTYNGGVYRFNEAEGTLQHFSLANVRNINHADFILSIYSDSKNNIWIGTYGGVYQFNVQTEKFKYYVQSQNDPSGLSNNYVYSILEDSKGNLWFGTASGLNRLNTKTYVFRHFYQRDGLPSDVIFGIVEDNSGGIWLSTNKGLSRYHSKDNSFINFDKNDGLQGNVFNPLAYLKSADGTVYFGGLNGLSFLKPSSMTLSEFNPPVVITSIKIRNEDGEYIEIVPENDLIELEPEQNSISIEFAALDYTNPKKNRYQYKLFGYEEDWIELTEGNSVTFSRLPHGNYSFQLMGTNSDGIWSENFASISFIITPHFWQTWWFVPAVIIGLVLILFLGYLLILKTKIKRAVRVQKIKEEENERVRKKTAIDFHDELGHRLTRISLLTEIVKQKIGITFSEINPLLDQISENSARLYDGTKDFIWAIDPQKDSLYELIIRLKDFGDEIFGSTDVHFNVEGISEELQKASLDMDWKRHLMLIFKEGMNNSLKHSNSKTVSLTSSVKEDEFELSLADDGAGFEIDKSPKGNGLKNMQKRAEILNAEFQIESKPGNGTKLLLKGKFPIKSVNFN